MEIELQKAKVTLMGEAGVGKTSLVRRFVLDEFSDRYTPTLGAKVTKKEVLVKVGDEHVRTLLTIWDIMGVPTFRELLRDAFFHGTQGILAVCDLTRADTVDALPAWIKASRDVSGPVPIVILGNKTDLTVDPRAAAAMEGVGSSIGTSVYRTSAKTGDKVNLAFQELAASIAKCGWKTQRVGER